MIETNNNLAKSVEKSTSYNHLSKQRSVKKSIFCKPDFLDIYNKYIDNRCKGKKCWASLAQNDRKNGQKIFYKT